MKRSFIILFALVMLKTTPAHVTWHQSKSMFPAERTFSSIPDSVTKRQAPSFPGFPRPPAPPARKPVPQHIGTMNISTEIPCKLYVDSDTAGPMTTLNRVTVYNVPEGTHTLHFRNEQMDFRQTVKMEPGATCLYTLRRDTTLKDSLFFGKMIIKKGNLIVNRYVPFRHAWSFEVLPALVVNSRGFGFGARVMTGFTFNNKVRLGVGTGYFSYPTRIMFVRAQGFNPDNSLKMDYSKTFTEDFNFEYVPVFANIAINMMKNRTTTLLSIDIGASIPIIDGMTVGYASEHDTWTPNETELKIDRIRTGTYLGLNLGWKYFFIPSLEAGASLGFHASFSKFDGARYTGTTVFTTELRNKDKSFTSTCFTVNLMMVFHLDTKKLKRKHTSR